MSPRAFKVTRDITPTEFPYLVDKTIPADTTVYEFSGPTYGCIDWSTGIAVTYSPEGDNPFFELPLFVLKLSEEN